MKVNGVSVIRGSISLPKRGAWTSKLEVDTTLSMSGGVTLDPIGLVGTIVRGSAFADGVRLFIVGGNGGLRRIVPAFGYQSIPARTVALDILTYAGERLDPSSDVGGNLSHWGRKESTAGDALSALCEHLDRIWRVLPNGNVWIGVDTPIAATPQVLDRDELSGEILVGDDTPTLLHPLSVDGLTVTNICHEIGNAEVRSWLYFGGEDRVRSALERLVQKSLPRMSYLGPTPAKVVSQNEDGTLELRSEDTAAPHLSKVRFRYSTPGVRAEVRPGSKCFVFYDSADPSRPSAGLFEDGALDEITYTAPTVNIGDSSAAFLAHSAETIQALQAISSALQAVGMAATLAAVVPSALTTTTLLPILAPLLAVSPAVSAAIATLPTTRAKGT